MTKMAGKDYMVADISLMALSTHI